MNMAVRAFSATAVGAALMVTTAPSIAQIIAPFTTEDQLSHQPQVKIREGRLAGKSENGVDSFKGIPFAAAPVGPLRWRAPQPAPRWSGVRQATEYAHDCMQTPFPSIAMPLEAPLSEDCLYLNVWQPTGTRSNGKLPVMVWIHGGGFVNGGASPTVFRGDSFARQGVIMVGIAYRVGRFGFFAHPALTRANEDDGLLGNYGIMDEIAALRWVQTNIAAFGGDPGNVTIFGESAGGTSVQILLSTPLAQGLFARAIIQSGGGLGNPMNNRHVTRDNDGLPSLETVGSTFARQNGIDGSDAAALAALRALPAHVIDGGLHMGTVDGQSQTYGGPAIDGRIFPGPLDALYAAGKHARVPLIIGATSADLSRLGGLSKDELFAQFSNAAALRAVYDPDGTATDATVAAAVGGDLAMVEPARRVAEITAKQKLPVWAFRFSYVADAAKAKNPAGAPHASDVPYVMNTVRYRYGAATQPRDEAVGTMMNRYWANFAKTGDPNGPGLPRWPRYDPVSDQLMDFTEEGNARATPDPRKVKLDLITEAAK